jgi:hypothetical protein
VATTGEIIVGGRSNSTPSGEYDPYLLKLSSAGDFIAEQWYYFPGNDEIFDFSATTDGGFVLVGDSRASSETTLGSHDYALLVKAGPGLTREWYSLRTGWSACEGYTGSGSGVSAAISNLGTILYATTTVYWDYWGITMCGPEIDHAYVSILENDGTQIDYVALAAGWHGDFKPTGFMNWVLSSDHSSNIIGIYRQSIVSDFWITEIDNSYNTISDVSIELPTQYHLTDAAWLPQGVIIGADNSLKRFSTDGLLLGEMTITSSQSLGIESFLATSDNKMLITGTIYTPTDEYDALIMLIDPDF